MDQKLERVIMTRPGVGKEGRNINLISNHFHVRFTGTDTVFYNYSVTHSSSVTLIAFLLSFYLWPIVNSQVCFKDLWI